jgi:PAS domain-containing protein
MTDKQGRITWVNQAFSKVTEFEPGEVIGRKPGSFLQDTDSDRSSVGYMREEIVKKMAFNSEISQQILPGRALARTSI